MARPGIFNLRLYILLPAPTPKALKNGAYLLMMDTSEESLGPDDSYDALRYAVKSCNSCKLAFPSTPPPTSPQEPFAPA